MTRKLLISTLGVVLLFVSGLAYIVLVVAQYRPLNDPMRITVELVTSGGLLDRSEVTYRGYKIGKIDAIRLRPGGVAVDLAIDEGTQIPADSDVSVAGLSAAGEQYLDFKPRTDTGPYLTDGASIDQRRTSVPVPFAQLMTNLTGLSEQIDPTKLNIVVTELEKAFHRTGPDLAKILDGGSTILSGLQGVLPQTTSLLNNGQIVLGTVNDLSDERNRFATAGGSLADTLRSSDPEIRELLDKTPHALQPVDQLLRENQPTMAALLGDLGSVSEIAALRQPAIDQYLPGLHKAADAFAAISRNGALQVIADPFPRQMCDYGKPKPPPTQGGSPPPLIYQYCPVTGPTLLQRGAQNVPRPPGDDTSGPPPGVTGHERQRPTGPAPTPGDPGGP